MDNRPIGFLDSGVGGLTVVKQSLKQLPNEGVIFIGDQARLPYGPRPQEQVLSFTQELVSFLLTKNVKMVVIACNTATAAALPTIKKELDIPVIGVINSGSRAAIRATKNKDIAVISTEGTAKAHAYRTAIHKKDASIKVSELATPKFVPLVESNEYKTPIAKHVVFQSLKPLRHGKMDTLIMGCTHYPLLRPIIKQFMGPNVTLIDPGEETVSDVSAILDHLDIYAGEDNKPEREFYTTGSTKMFDEIASDWLELNQIHANHVDVEKG